MERVNLLVGSVDKRKRKRETKKIRKIRKMEEKLRKQEEFTNQLQSEIHSIFKHLTTIQEHLVSEHRSHSVHAPVRIRPSSPAKKSSPFPIRFQQDSTYTVTSNDNSSDDDEESKSRSTWDSQKNIISIFHSHLQPHAQNHWKHTGTENSYQSTMTQNTLPSHYSTALQSRFSVDGGPTGAGAGGGGGGGGSGVGGRGGGEAGPRSHHTAIPEAGGGGGGAGGGQPPHQEDSPCDCTLTRQACKCKGGVQSVQPPAQASSKQASAVASFRTSPASSRERAAPLTEKDKAMCSCKGSGKMRRECPLKAKRRLNAATAAANLYKPTGPQEFTDKELDNVFDVQSEPDVHLDDNEQVFMDVFPALNTDLSHHHEWPMPFTPMQDFTHMSNMFAEPFSFTDSELARAFDEEDEPEEVTVDENECVFMDQFPDLTEPTRVPRGAGGKAPKIVAGVPSSSSACSGRKGRPTKAAPDQQIAPSIPVQPTPEMCGEVPLPDCTCTECVGAVSKMSPDLQIASSIPDQPTGEMCGEVPLPDCTCTNCVAGVSNMSPAGNIEVPSTQVTAPSGLIMSPTMPSEPTVQQEMSDVASECSCDPCPSYDGDGDMSPRPPSQPLSQVSKQLTPETSHVSKVTVEASAQTCPNQLGQTYKDCMCEPNCTDYLAKKGISGPKPQGSGQQPGGKTLAPPGPPKPSSSLQIDQPCLASGEPQEWSSKDLEHAFSEEKISFIELSPQDALFMDQFPQAAQIPTFIRMPQPNPFTPMQDFSSVPQDRFANPQEFSDKELATAFEEEDIPDVQLSENERNFMNEFPEIAGPGGGKPQATRLVSSAAGKICRCPKKIVIPCKCKQRRNQQN